jgi:uncharacterized protein
MRCDYCYVDHDYQVMDAGTAYKVIDNAINSANNKVGIAFFGGEPLLHKDLIRNTVAYGRKKSSGTETKFYFKLTTNGLLLDEEFVQYCQKENIAVGLSLDGTAFAHDLHRLDKSGQKTYKRVEKAASILLEYLPNSPVMMTINPDTVKHYFASVEHLFNMGFVYILVGINYAANWQESDMRELKKQYKKLADFYYKNTIAENKFYLSPFESKISSHINKLSYCHDRCELGKKQISVAPNGSYYPCLEFVNDEAYKIGNVNDGIINYLQMKLIERSNNEQESCEGCAIKKRCNHYCACQNKRATGSINQVSPVLCHSEQILLPIVDKLAERLYKQRNAVFIQKHYNELYPILSVIENKTRV